MRADEFDEDVIVLVRGLRAAGVEHLLLEDDDAHAVTVIPGPSRRNLERLARALKRLGAVTGGPKQRRLHYDQLVHGGAARWPIQIDGADADIMIVDIADGRWGRYFEAAFEAELEPGLKVGVVPDEPILSARRGTATDVMPELELPWRERDELRMRRRRALRRAERRGVLSSRRRGYVK